MKLVVRRHKDNSTPHNATADVEEIHPTSDKDAETRDSCHMAVEVIDGGPIWTFKRLQKTCIGGTLRLTTDMSSGQ
ncbi:hypothetical protein J6590_023210 [Homalodisca vitripennis]|nr:hypothetical protein J6590_023210 [Homalodisca vitripennis]